jgi:hypothetical protein
MCPARDGEHRVCQSETARSGSQTRSAGYSGDMAHFRDVLDHAIWTRLPIWVAAFHFDEALDPNVGHRQRPKQRPPGRAARPQLVRPLDHGDPVAAPHLLEAEVEQLGQRPGAIRVDVVHGHAAPVLVDEREGGTRDLGLHAEPSHEALDEARLARAPLADDRQPPVPGPGAHRAARRPGEWPPGSRPPRG